MADENVWRTARFPVRLSLNVTAETAELLARWVRRTGWTQGELAREALCKGLPLVVEGYRKRQRRQEEGLRELA